MFSINPDAHSIAELCTEQRPIRLGSDRVVVTAAHGHCRSGFCFCAELSCVLLQLSARPVERPRPMKGGASGPYGSGCSARERDRA
jgi:hypothetical protein